MIKIIAIFLGGGVGSVLRYAIQLLMHEKIIRYNFPWATFIVNIVGCLLIGLFYALSAKFNWSPELRLTLTVGLCGGFTTFSTFSNDILEMFRTGQIVIPIIYISASLILGVLAVLAGNSISKLC